MNFNFKIILFFVFIFTTFFIISDEYKINENDFIGIWQGASNLTPEEMYDKELINNPNVTKRYLVVNKVNDYFIIFLIDYKVMPANNNMAIGIYDNKQYIKFIENNKLTGDISIEKKGDNFILYYDYDFPPEAAFEFIKMKENDLKLFKNEIEKLKELMK